LSGAFPGSLGVGYNVFVEVSYETRRADAWRCNLYLLFGNGKLIALWLAMLAGGWFFGPALFHASRWGGFGFAAWCVFLSVAPIAFLFWMSIGSQFPERNSSRACTTRLDADGVQDTTPDGTKFIPWASVSAIRLVRGDAYFITGGGRGFFVPRSAFAGEAQARGYVEEARRLQRVADRVPARRLAFEKGGVQSAAPIKPVKTQLSPRQQRGCLGLMMGSTVLIMLIAIGWGATGWWTDSRRVSEFHQSPGCTPTAPATSPLSPCTTQTLTVARAWFVYHSKSADDYELALQGPGVSQTVDVRRDFWEGLRAGNAVQAKLWHGNIVQVRAGGLTSRTQYDPDRDLRTDKSLLAVGLFGLAFFAFISWRDRRGKPKTAKPAATV